ncbi:hypothetical protein PMZ80_007129 [Knufia obscura]|uniref:Uncharacterized protein n=1 Tax=Knufia obscura TaxID=1635080 RepID=A0ABR0RJB8_9EURO|nr:hypothetical protein PMZ80_007129 [Knufia obscura]
MPAQELISSISGVIIDPAHPESLNTSSRLIQLLQSTLTELDHPELSDKRRHLAGLIQAVFAADSRPLPTCGACGGTGSKDNVPHLLNDLRSLALHRRRRGITCPPGPAGNGRRWVCPLCPQSKGNAITSRSNDMRTHLEDIHGYLSTHVKYVFDKTNNDAMFEYFGPYTEEEAHEKGLKVQPYKKNATTATKKRAKLTTKPVTTPATRPAIEPALPDLSKIRFPPFSHTPKPQVAVAIETKDAGTQTDPELQGATLLGTATDISKTETRAYDSYADALKAQDIHSDTTFELYPAADDPMTNSLVGIGAEHTSFFEDDFQDGIYLSSGNSSGESSFHREHKLPLGSSLQPSPHNGFVPDPLRAAYAALNNYGR